MKVWVILIKANPILSIEILFYKGGVGGRGHFLNIVKIC